MGSFPETTIDPKRTLMNFYCDANTCNLRLLEKSCYEPFAKENEGDVPFIETEKTLGTRIMRNDMPSLWEITSASVQPEMRCQAWS